MRILVTGGAGFVGSSLARLFKKEHPRWHVAAFDNLRRRGSELNLPLFKKLGIGFTHGDVRVREDLAGLDGRFDLFIEASAEPSVLAGVGGAPDYLIQSNLGGTVNCLDFARKRAGAFIFLSTSRVYSIKPLREIRLEETASRFEIARGQREPGISPAGVSEDFSTRTARSLYGATKLASELLIQEYAHGYGLRAAVDRCGVIAGAGQFGKTDQGVFTHWVASHYFSKPLSYLGFGGGGKQVRDILHPRDLYRLINRQWGRLQKGGCGIHNAGGGRDVSASLLELTALCRDVTGRKVPVSRVKKTSPVDIPLYLSDCAKARAAFDWRPEIGVRAVISEIHGWLRRDERRLKAVFT